MVPFATVEDYEARYGEVDDEARVSALLQDATNVIASQPGFELLGGDDTFVGVLESLIHGRGATARRAKAMATVAEYLFVLHAQHSGDRLLHKTIHDCWNS